MNPVYYDTSYLLKLLIVESGSHAVRAHASTVLEIHSASHGRAEFESAAFRKVREGAATSADFRRLMMQFHEDCLTGAIVFLPLTDAILNRVEMGFFKAPMTCYLRAGDALHLATAADHGFTEIYSNDIHLLAAAPLFGLRGMNLIP